jgi:small subunit ribosomal protein S16
VAVRIRMKRLGRKNRPFYRVCAVDQRTGRDGRVLEELGHYDPLVKEVDARAILDGERIAHWVSKGAQPSEKVAVLIKKYGPNGTHLEAQKQALERIKTERPQAPAPVYFTPKAKEEPEAAVAEGETPAAEATAEGESSES